MHGRVLCFAVVMCALPIAASADDSSKSPKDGPTTTITTGNVSYTVPFEFPSADEVLKALPNAGIYDHSARIRCELIQYQEIEPRFYPLVGQARLVKAHFKCTVAQDYTIGKAILGPQALSATTVVYINHDRLIK